jgi:hypothetical protein
MRYPTINRESKYEKKDRTYMLRTFAIPSGVEELSYDPETTCSCSEGRKLESSEEHAVIGS